MSFIQPLHFSPQTALCYPLVPFPVRVLNSLRISPNQPEYQYCKVRDLIGPAQLFCRLCIYLALSKYHCWRMYDATETYSSSIVSHVDAAYSIRQLLPKPELLEDTETNILYRLTAQEYGPMLTILPNLPMVHPVQLLDVVRDPASFDS